MARIGPTELIILLCAAPLILVGVIAGVVILVRRSNK